MSVLRRLFAIGRLTRAPAGQSAGRVLPPASVQRTQLGLREVDLPGGIVTLRSGEVRAIMKVSGLPLHHRSAEQARIFMTAWANALNALPPEAVWLIRSRPGGLEWIIRAKRNQAAALATREPGSGLAMLAADQLAHARKLDADGSTRKTDNYLAVRNARGDVRALLQAASAAQARLHEAGLQVTLLKDRALAQAIAESWQPDAVEHWWQDVAGPDGVATLTYSPGAARVVTPRYTEALPEPERGDEEDGELPADTGEGPALPATNGTTGMNRNSTNGRKALPR